MSKPGARMITLENSFPPCTHSLRMCKRAFLSALALCSNDNEISRTNHKTSYFCLFLHESLDLLNTKDSRVRLSIVFFVFTVAWQRSCEMQISWHKEVLVSQLFPGSSLAEGGCRAPMTSSAMLQKAAQGSPAGCSGSLACSTSAVQSSDC